MTKAISCHLYVRDEDDDRLGIKGDITITPCVIFADAVCAYFKSVDGDTPGTMVYLLDASEMPITMDFVDFDSEMQELNGTANN